MNLALLRHGSLKCLILIENCLFSVAHRDKKVLLMSFLLFSALTNTTSMKSTCWHHVCHPQRQSTFAWVVQNSMNVIVKADTGLELKYW